MSVTTDSSNMVKMRAAPMESIEIKPSTELIPDEYEHTDNKNGVVHVFVGNITEEKENLKKLKLTFENCNYPMETHPIDTKENVEKKLNELASKNYDNKTCFIMIFLGCTKIDMVGCILPEKEKELNNPIMIKNVWSKFITCKSLKNKPKIFIFQAAYEPNRTRTDSVGKHDSKYDVPVEADLFIAYKLISWLIANEFVNAFCNNIEKSGGRDDILDIITHTDIDDRRPLIISTLTRKFYVTASKARGHYYDIVNHVETSRKTLDEVEIKVRKLHKNGKRPENITIIVDEQPEAAANVTSKQLMPKSPDFKSNKSSKTGSYNELNNNPSSPKTKERVRSVSISHQPLPMPTTPTRPRANSKGKASKPPWRS